MLVSDRQYPAAVAKSSWCQNLALVCRILMTSGTIAGYRLVCQNLVVLYQIPTTFAGIRPTQILAKLVKILPVQPKSSQFAKIRLYCARFRPPSLESGRIVPDSSETSQNLVITPKFSNSSRNPASQ
jgi:hypothetical protein